MAREGPLLMGSYCEGRPAPSDGTKSSNKRGRRMRRPVRVVCEGAGLAGTANGSSASAAFC